MTDRVDENDGRVDDGVDDDANLARPPRGRWSATDLQAPQKPKKPGASIPELAVEYKISESTLYSMANREALPGARRFGKRIIIHRETFEAWIAEGHGV